MREAAREVDQVLIGLRGGRAGRSSRAGRAARARREGRRDTAGGARHGPVGNQTGGRATTTPGYRDVMGTGRRLTVLLLALALIGITRRPCFGSAASALVPLRRPPRSPRPRRSAPCPDRPPYLDHRGYVRRTLPDVARRIAGAPVVSGGVAWPSEGFGSDAGAVAWRTSSDAASGAPASHQGFPLPGGADPRNRCSDCTARTRGPRPERGPPGSSQRGAKAPLVVLVVSKGIGHSDVGRSASADVRGRWAD